MKRILSLLLIFVLSQTIYAENLSPNKWDVDLDYLTKELTEKHYDFYTLQSKEDFLSGIEAIKLQAQELSDFEVALKTQQLIAKGGDLHTTLAMNTLINKEQILPIHLYWYSDGLYILHTVAQYKEILGSRLVAINDVPIETVVDSLSTLFTMDNQAVIKSRIPQLIASLQILEYFGFANSKEATFKVILEDDVEKELLLDASAMTRNNRVSIQPTDIAFCWRNERTFFTDTYFPDDGLYYILYNRCWGKEAEMEYGDKQRAESFPSFDDFVDSALSTINNNNINKILFDIRFNSGGNSAQGTNFIRRLAEYLESNPEVKVYVVLGRQTFSSAILNALDFKQLTNVVFVGEETSGRPNHFGEVRGFQLPQSQIPVFYSTKYFQKIDDDISTISPDVKIEMSFSDFMKGIDPVLEWVKKQ